MSRGRMGCVLCEPLVWAPIEGAAGWEMNPLGNQFRADKHVASPSILKRLLSAVLPLSSVLGDSTWDTDSLLTLSSVPPYSRKK